MLPALKSERCFQRINKFKSINLNKDRKMYSKFQIEFLCFVDITIYYYWNWNWRYIIMMKPTNLPAFVCILPLF